MLQTFGYFSHKLIKNILCISLTEYFDLLFDTFLKRSIPFEDICGVSTDEFLIFDTFLKRSIPFEDICGISTEQPLIYLLTNLRF